MRASHDLISAYLIGRIQGGTIIVNPNDESAAETTAKSNKVRLDPISTGYTSFEIKKLVSR